jgi:hypothetical protein
MSAILLFLGLLQTEPLPELDSFLDATRSALVEQLDEDSLLEGYAYRRRTIREETVSEHDIFRFDSGRYEKLISENGIYSKPSDLDKVSGRSDTNPSALIDDMFRIWDFQMVGRETVRGRPAIVVAYAPRHEAKPQTRSGRWFLKNARGVAWIDEQDHRVVRFHTEVMNDISLAWGLLAKVHKGTEVVREWQKVNDEIWLPSMSIKRVRARALMVGVQVEEIEQYFDYRRLDIETKLPPGGPR